MIMPMKHKKVIVTRRLPEPVTERMRALFDVQTNDEDRIFSQAELVNALRHCDVLVPTITDRLDGAMLKQAGPDLKLIANFGNGFDNIDVLEADRRGITVTNTPGVLTGDTADMTMALMLAVPRRLHTGVEFLLQSPQDWKGWAPTGMLGHRIWGKKLGIIGMGRIGTAVARRAKAFGLEIHYHNRRPIEEGLQQELDATYWDSLDQMLSRVDIVSLHCPHTPATFHLLSARRLSLMKPTAYIINTSRGEVIDEKAMIAMLQDNTLAGAGLDVYEHEPMVDPKLLKLAKEGKVILLPHMGSATIESRLAMGEKVIINIRVFFDGHSCPDRVLPDMV
jgi:glyoxylate reductase